LIAPSSAGLFDNLLGCGSGDHEGEGDHRAGKFVELPLHIVGSGGAIYLANDRHVGRLSEGARDDGAIQVALSVR
jgi:hypothetical protein